MTTIREGVEQAAGHGTQVIWKQGAPVADTDQRRPRPPAARPAQRPGNATAAAQRDEAVAAAKDADAVVVAVGESPYAEGPGDDGTPALPPAQAALVDDAEGHRASR